MKRFSTLFISLLIGSTQLVAQKAILINGGQFGNPNERVNVVTIDVPTLTYDTLDTIRTGSVQDMLISGDQFFVVAQDSIIKYDVSDGIRLAEQSFEGPSTRTLVLHGDELLVGNWFGKSSSNLYIYDAEDLQLLDSVIEVTKGVTSMLIDSDFVYISQNESTSSFEDTLGTIIKVDIANRMVVDTISVSGYTGDIGQLIRKPDGSGLYSINSFSNTITTVEFSTSDAINTSFNHDFDILNRSQWTQHEDTAFLRMNGGIGAISLTDLAVVDSLIIDTVATAFTYDTLNRQFLVTQTDFFSYTRGKIFSRSGVELDTLITGFSPEVIKLIQASSPVGISEIAEEKFDNELVAYPNPTDDFVTISLKGLSEEGTLLMYNSSGQLLLKRNMTLQEERLDLSNYDSGLYFISFIRGEEGITRKILKR